MIVCVECSNFFSRQFLYIILFSYCIPNFHDNLGWDECSYFLFLNRDRVLLSVWSGDQKDRSP